MATASSLAGTSAPHTASIGDIASFGAVPTAPTDTSEKRNPPGTASLDDIVAVHPMASGSPDANQPVSASGTASLNDIIAVHPKATGTASIGDIAAIHPLPQSVKGSESWLGHAWDWANTPLINLNPKNQGGFTGGAEDVASGFTSPLSIGLTVGTLGSGWALRGLGIAGSELPVVVQGLKTLVNAGFTAQQAYGAIQTTPRVLDALKTGDYDEAKRLAVHAVAGFGGAYLGLRGLVPEAQSLGERVNLLKPQEGYTATRRELGRYLADRTANAQEAKLFDENAREALPAKDKITLGAISRYIESGGNRGVLQERLDSLSARQEVAENYTTKERADLLSKYDRAMNLSPEEVEFADKLRGQLADNFTLAHEHGVINSAVENYITHIWEDEKNPAVNRTLHQASTGRFSTNVSMARERSFATSYEGEMLGRKLKTDDPVALTANHTQAVRNAIAARGFLDRLRDVNASDGRPMVVMAGAGTPVEDATLIHPDRIRSIQINKSTLQNLIRTGRLDDLIDSGAVVRLPGAAGAEVPENGRATQPSTVRNPDEIYMRPASTSRATPTGAAVELSPEEHADLEREAGRKLTTEQANLMLRAKAESGMIGALGTPDEASAIRQEHRAKLEQPDETRYQKPNFAYRLRDVGESGVPSASHSQATMSEDEARSYMAGRSAAQGGSPQELVRIDLNKLKPEEFTRKPGPNDVDWVKFNRDLSESEIEKVAQPKPKPVAERYPADVIELAESQMRGLVDLANTLPRAGRYFSESTAEEHTLAGRRNIKGGERMGGQWFGITSQKENIAGQYPWFDKETTASKVQRAIEKPGGADYQRIVSKIGDHIVRERAASTNALRDYIPQLTQLSEQVKDVDPDLSARLTELAEGKTTVAPDNLKQYIDEVIADAETARQFSEAVDTAASEARQAGASEARGDVDRPRAENGPGRSATENQADEDQLTTAVPKRSAVRPSEPLPTPKAEQSPRYAWNPHDYRAIDHPAFRDWIFGANDTAGNPIYVKTEMRVHPEASEYVERGIGADKSPIRESAIGRAALKAGGEAKSSLLAFSPFHVMQEGLRAIMTGISPFGVDRWDLNTDPILRQGVEHGLTLGKDYRGLSDLTEGVGGNSKLIEKVPVLGRMQTQLHKFLFDDYIPSLKARGYRNLVERYRAANPTWSPDKVMSEAAADTNSRFGGINYKMLGRSLTSQDAARLTVLAPDWLESEVRFMARALNPGSEGKIARADLARIGIYTFAAARLLNLLTTGKPHLEAPFGVIHKDRQGREIEFSFRTPLTDIGHALSDPAEFLKGRANPLTVRTGVEVFTGRDEYGRRVTPGQQVSDVIKNVSPIPFQTAAQRITGARPDMNTAEQVAKAAGASVYQYRTEAEKLAAQLASDRTETGPVDKTALARHRAKLQAEDAVRSGDKFDLTGFSLRERKDIHANAKLTPLQARFSRLPMGDALQVWNAATRAEKTELRHELAKKRFNYLEHANTNMSRDERQSDPVYAQVKGLKLDQYARVNEELGAKAAGE